jgi:Ring finger domain
MSQKIGFLHTYPTICLPPMYTILVYLVSSKKDELCVPESCHRTLSTSVELRLHNRYQKNKEHRFSCCTAAMFFQSNDIHPLSHPSIRSSHGLITSSSMDHNNASTESRHHFYQPPHHHQRNDENNDNQSSSHGRSLPNFVCKCLRYCMEGKESEEATNSNVNATPSTVQMLDRISDGNTPQQQHNSCCGWTVEASSSSSPSPSSSFWISQWVFRVLSRSTSTLLQPSYEPIETETWIYSSPTETTAITSTSPYSESTSSPLRTANSFHCSKDVMTIRNDEIVLPGSMLQKTMAQKMFDSMPKKVTSYYNEAMDVEDECVICMDGFTEDNPRMPTHCGCGENKTYFHLPCLYHWMEQSSDCPSCRRTLTWEEF